MKRLYLAFFLLTILSCQKEKVKCNCGLILDDDVTNYSVKIRNDCSKNEKWFTLQPGDWMNAHPGDNYCITNIDKW